MYTNVRLSSNPFSPQMQEEIVEVERREAELAATQVAAS
jgi:hypothetical protein